MYRIFKFTNLFLVSERFKGDIVITPCFAC